MPEPKWTCLDDGEAVARSACERISAIAAGAIAARGHFSIVLAGGSTPRRCYELLAGTPQQWAHWSCFFGDERCLPADHPDRNSQLAARALLDKVSIAESAVHPIAAEGGGRDAASAYAALIADALPFDLVLLGLGEDGHTASIFPGHEAPPGERVYTIDCAPKPPPERVTLSAETLGNCRHLLFLITGSGKRSAVSQWRAGATIPAARIRARGRSEILTDRAAWPENAPPA